jgi:hypothetical protein
MNKKDREDTAKIIYKCSLSMALISHKYTSAYIEQIVNKYKDHSYIDKLRIIFGTTI